MTNASFFCLFEYGWTGRLLCFCSFGKFAYSKWNISKESLTLNQVFIIVLFLLRIYECYAYLRVCGYTICACMHSEAQICHQVSSTVAPHFIYWVTWAPPLGCQWPRKSEFQQKPSCWEKRWKLGEEAEKFVSAKRFHPDLATCQTIF